jgi:hypothetical protein
MTKHEEFIARLTVRVAAPLLIGFPLGKSEDESLEKLRNDCPNEFGHELIEVVLDEWHSIRKESDEWHQKGKPPLS